ncbi:DUF1365 family protein [Paraburkholderia acidisoli]|uniref:DUF1365 family protein n=2 Tax=Paraburkholderia acidisoli TaxID=2571748 RepID=A0A7Z2GPW7_9BURK|nr:DUF1365 family protein [Paraburkholderia acidisoli]
MRAAGPDAEIDAAGNASNAETNADADLDSHAGKNARANAVKAPPFARAALQPPAAYWLTGLVYHERRRPVRHAFTYALFQVCCDLDRLDAADNRWFGVNRRRLLSLDTRDYGPRDGRALAPWMRAQLAEAGIPADGAIWLQAIPRIAGYAFNPVAFWYCYDRDGRLRALYADVRNTFGAYHGYLLSAPGHAPIDEHTELRCRKTFHVSPFCRVEGRYTFRVRQREAHLTVAIDYHDDTNDSDDSDDADHGPGAGPLLRTSVALRADPLDAARALQAVALQPFNALAVVLRIHWQALRLWRLRVPFFGKTPPAPRRAQASPRSSAGSASNTPDTPDASLTRHPDHEVRS